MNRHKLTVAHRVCPELSRTAYGYATKLEMVRECSASMLESLRGLDARIVVILDGCTDEYADCFPGCEILRTDKIGNQATFARQIDLLAGADSDFVYFSEDDYLYSPKAFREMLEFAETTGADCVTPIDHPDRYNSTVLEPGRTRIRAGKLHHWREVGTTCLTFLTRPETVRRYRRELETYVHGEQDSVMWLGMTRFGLQSPYILLAAALALFRRLLGANVYFGRFLPILALARHNIWLVTKSRVQLWSPMPEVARHLSFESKSPVAFDVVYEK